MLVIDLVRSQNIQFLFVLIGATCFGRSRNISMRPIHNNAVIAASQWKPINDYQYPILGPGLAFIQLKS